jgi:hypothetical protein
MDCLWRNVVLLCFVGYGLNVERSHPSSHAGGQLYSPHSPSIQVFWDVMLRHWSAVPDVSKDCVASIFEAKYVYKTNQCWVFFMD